MLKKFLIILTLLISSFICFAEENYIERLEENNKIINKLIERVENQNSEISNLENKIEEKNKKIRKLENRVSSLTTSLEDSNHIINSLTERIKEDQKEIKNLRALLDDTSSYVEEGSNFITGTSLTYPLGGQIIFGANLNALPFGIYTTFSMNRDLYVTGGIGLLFEF